MGGLQKAHSYCHLFEKAVSVQDVPLTLNTKENLPSFKQKKAETIGCSKNSESWGIACAWGLFSLRKKVKIIITCFFFFKLNHVTFSAFSSLYRKRNHLLQIKYQYSFCLKFCLSLNHSALSFTNLFHIVRTMQQNRTEIIISMRHHRTCKWRQSINEHRLIKAGFFCLFRCTI